MDGGGADGGGQEKSQGNVAQFRLQVTGYPLAHQSWFKVVQGGSKWFKVSGFKLGVPIACELHVAWLAQKTQL